MKDKADFMTVKTKNRKNKTQKIKQNFDFCTFPRKPRIDIPKLLYHLMVRGIERREIFK